jgi:hypothetical protein
MANETVIDFIIGMPPKQPQDDAIGEKTNVVLENSMPLVRIYPGIPSFTTGLSLFRRDDYFAGGGKGGRLSYSTMLKKHGFTLSSDLHTDHVKIAYLADSFPTDSFTNEYGENFLQGLTDVSSTAAASVAQMFGQTTASGALKDIFKKLEEQGGVAATIGEAAGKGAKATGEFIKSLPIVGGGANILNAIVAGGRVDFPMLWKSSGFQPSYTMTIRLYNPNPGNREATHKYIAGPIAALMLLGLPQSSDESGSTYNWPYLHRIWSPGIYDLDPAFISNITVIKGGDQQQIAYNQNLGIVDVRIDFGSLFSSILATTVNQPRRPTLKKYIDGISGIDSRKSGIQNFSTVGNSPETVAERKKAQNRSASPLSLRKTRNQAPTLTELTTEEIQNPPNRVNSLISKIANKLEKDSTFKVTINL